MLLASTSGEEMRVVDLEIRPRREHFDRFENRADPYVDMTAPQDLPGS